MSDVSWISYEDAISSIPIYGTAVLDDYYKYKGVEYLAVSTNAKIQENDEWIDAVIYTSASNILFTRSAEEFNEKFAQIKQDS